ncbi:hypothetical protein SSCG_00136 [Streptomyces clavuligerus]|nr:hypothetical protein SSCG_00136 [Streptomyces clavuligerus]
MKELSRPGDHGLYKMWSRCRMHHATIDLDQKLRSMENES